jgi:hypothetical protein
LRSTSTVTPNEASAARPRSGNSVVRARCSFLSPTVDTVPIARCVAVAAALLTMAACGAAPHAQQAVSHTQPTATPRVVAPSPAAAVYPLTGLPASDAARSRLPALSVKIDNIGPALPQAGLNQADLVADILVEGGLTRLMATFQSQNAPLIGPIRSARPVDADLLRELNGGIFAYSGAAPGEIAPSKAHSTALLVSNDNDPRWFWRAADRAAPHNVFSSTQRLYQAGRTLRPALHGAPQLFTYDANPPVAPAAHAVSIPFSGLSSAGWTWNGSSYLRTQNGTLDRLVGGARVATTNVVILSVTWRPTNIIDDAGNADPYVIVTGSGRAWVLRNGKVIAGRWVRPSYRVPMRLVDPSGRTIALAPGRSWLELQPRPYAPAFR